MVRTSCIAVAACLFTSGGVCAAEPAAQPWAETSGTIGKTGDMPQGRLTSGELQRLIAIGGDLFAAKFTALEGAGRANATQAILPTKRRNPAQSAFSRTSGPDANACTSCHNDPLPGGAGDFTTTTFVSEGFANADFDTTDPQFSNERGTNHLFGAGLIELLAREMTADLDRHSPRGFERRPPVRRAATCSPSYEGCFLRPHHRPSRRTGGYSRGRRSGCRSHHPPVQPEGRDDRSAPIFRQRHEPSPRYPACRAVRRTVDGRGGP